MLDSTETGSSAPSGVGESPFSTGDGPNKTPRSNGKNAPRKRKPLIGPLDEKMDPFYGVDDCGHIADWDNEAALIGCAFLDPSLVVQALDDLELENPLDLFNDKRHREIYRLAREIFHERKLDLDLVTFRAALKTEEEAERIDRGMIAKVLGEIRSHCQGFPKRKPLILIQCFLGLWRHG
jgi:hypothetical protein